MEKSASIQKLTMGAIAPSLGLYIKLDQPVSQTEEQATESSPLLRFLREHHGGLLNELCCLDLTVYEHGLESKPFFHVIAPSASLAAYKSCVSELVKPEVTPEGEWSYSIALNTAFRGENSLIIIDLPPLRDTATSELDPALVEEHYPLVPYGAARCEYPPLDTSLNRFSTILKGKQKDIRSSNGDPIQTLICCNFTITERAEAGPFRSVGQLFLGFSARPRRRNKSMRPEIAAIIEDVGFLLYRGGSAGLLFGAGKDFSRSIFAHEAKQLVQLIHDWPIPLASYFDVIEGSPRLTIQLKEAYEGFRISDGSLILSPEYFTAATDQILAWTMAGSSSDLPFYDSAKGGLSLPSNLGELLASCHNAAMKQCALYFLRVAGTLHLGIAGMRELDGYLYNKMPKVVLSGSILEDPLKWRSDKSQARLVDFSRLMMVIFREAIQHGSWEHEIKVFFEVSRDARGTFLDLKVRNSVRVDDQHLLFGDAPDDLPLTREELRNALVMLHRGTPTFSPVGGEGRRQMEFLAGYAGGNLVYSGPEESSPTAPWIVHCKFDPQFYTKS